MDAKLLPSEAELQGNTAEEAIPSSEISSDMQTEVSRDKTKPSS
jgi:hypothetical protein